jgi:hypothetical protein
MLSFSLSGKSNSATPTSQVQIQNCLLVTNSSNISNRDGKNNFQKVKWLSPLKKEYTLNHPPIAMLRYGSEECSLSLSLGEIEFNHTNSQVCSELLASHKQLEYLEQRLKETICNKSTGKSFAPTRRRNPPRTKESRSSSQRNFRKWVT